MEVTSKIIKCKYSDKFNIIPLGDIHAGSKNCEKEKFEEMVEWIKGNKNTYWLGMGDYCEFINLDDKRFDPRNIDPAFINDLDDLAKKQAEYIIKVLKPISDKCLGMLDGNHEETIRTKNHYDVGADICNQLNTPRLGWNAFIRLSFIRNKNVYRLIKIFATHGTGGGGLIGAKTNKIINLAKDFESDIYLFAHVHEKLIVSRDLMTCSNSTDKLIRKRKVYALTGSYANTYKEGTTNYGEKKLYSPGVLGSVKIIIKPFREVKGKKNGGRYNLPPDIHATE